MTKKLTIEDMQALAAERGGEFLSPVYENIIAKYLWRCRLGHEWLTTPNSVKNLKSWCPACAGVQQPSLADMHALASEHDGEFLSQEYKLSQSKYLWRCRLGHEWAATQNSVKKGSWCPECAGVKKLTLEEMQQLAAKRGGKFLSLEYKDNSTKHLWQCSEGHEFTAMPQYVKNRGCWCPTCARNKKCTIEDMQALAAERGGKFLSLEYKNQQTKCRWRCAHGHEWMAKPNNVKTGTWCPFCRGRSNTFMKKHPTWLIRKQRGLEKLKEIAAKNNGEFLSLEYETGYTKYLWRCEQGHEWSATAFSVHNKGHWCPTCANERSRRPRKKA